MNSVVAEYKTRKLKQLFCFYTQIRNYQKKNKENNPITIASKRINYLGINLNKEVKDLYSENCKTLIK